MAGWMPGTPAQTAAASPAAHSSSGASPHRRTGFAATAWSKLKQRFSRSGGRGHSGGTNRGQQLGGAAPAVPLPGDAGAKGRTNMLHTTPAVFALPADSSPFTAAAGQPARVSRPPAPLPSAGGPPFAQRSSAGGLLPPRATHGRGSSSCGGTSDALWRQGSGSAADPDDTVRRLAFASPGSAGAPGAGRSLPTAIPQQSSHMQRTSAHPSHRQPGSWQQPRALPATPRDSSLPCTTALGSAGGFGFEQLQQLLGVPAHSGLAGRWVREARPAGEGDGAADVDFLLQMPPAQAAARERTCELQVRAAGMRVGCTLPVGARRSMPRAPSQQQLRLPTPPPNADPRKRRRAGSGVGDAARQRLLHAPCRGGWVACE